MSDATFRIDVHYPTPKGAALRLRTELDWDSDLEPTAVGDGGLRHRFEVTAARPFLYFKPVLRAEGALRWAQGENCLAAAPSPHVESVHPFFSPDGACNHCEVHDVGGDAFPNARHDEAAWATRAHLPLQLLLRQSA